VILKVHLRPRAHVVDAVDLDAAVADVDLDTAVADLLHYRKNASQFQPLWYLNNPLSVETVSCFLHSGRSQLQGEKYYD
jgi:hypothetical protein